MKRKPNIKYDPRKAKKSQVNLKHVNEINGKKDKEESKDTINQTATVRKMEPILDEIMESLEQFEKPLNINVASFLEPEIQETVKLDNTKNDSAEFIEALNVEPVSYKLFENNLSQMEVPVNEKKEERRLNVVESELESDVVADNESDIKPNLQQPDIANDFGISEKERNVEKTELEGKGQGEERKKEERIKTGLKEKLKGGNVHADSITLKEVVKKIIQEKMGAVKLKKDLMEEKTVLEVPKLSAKIKRIVPMRIESPQRIKIIAKREDLKEKPLVIQELKEKLTIVQELKEKPAVVEDLKTRSAIIQETIEKPVVVQRTASENKPINVKESIRNIINQFKEFEKDFVHEDSEINRRELSVESLKTTTKAMEYSHKENEEVTVETKEAKTIRDAKESLRDIINQFKQIKSELTSEEDDQFEKIEATYMERPIAETLMQFSEALKNLIQRRKKTKSISDEVNKKVTANLTVTKETVENPQFSREEPEKLLKAQSSDEEDKVRKVTQGIQTAMDDSNLSANNKNVLLNVQKSTNSAVNTNHATKEDNEEARGKILGNSSKE